MHGVESESDRLAMLKSAGGEYFAAPLGPLLALLEENAASAGEIGVDAIAPRLMATAAAARAAGVRPGVSLRSASGVVYLVRRLVPESGMVALEVEPP